MNTVIFTIVCFCGVGAYLWWFCAKEQRAHASRRERFQARRQMPLRAWYDANFRELRVPMDDATRIVSALAAELGCHPTQISASDRFDAELKFTGPPFVGLLDDGDHVIDSFFDGTLREVIGSEIDLIDFSDVRTVGDLVKVVSELMWRDVKNRDATKEPGEENGGGKQ